MRSLLYSIAALLLAISVIYFARDARSDTIPQIGNRTTSSSQSSPVAATSSAELSRAGPSASFVLDRWILSESAIQLFAFSASEVRHLQEAINKLRTDLYDLERSFTVDIIRCKDAVSFTILAYPEEIAFLRTQFEERVAAILGDSRGRSFLEAANRSLEAKLQSFGAIAKHVTIKTSSMSKTVTADAIHASNAILSSETFVYNLMAADDRADFNARFGWIDEEPGT